MQHRIEDYQSLFARFTGKTVGYLRLDGNVGDQLIEQSAYQLFKHYGITLRILNEGNFRVVNTALLKGLETVFVSGGGNLGVHYDHNYKMRRNLLKLYSGEVVILPQTMTDAGDKLVYSEVWLREKVSFKAYQGNKFLSHDLAFAFDIRPYEHLQPKYELGYFFRNDSEGKQDDQRNKINLADPAMICPSYTDYISLAASYKKIVTDRLHFAIIGLKLNREVVLIANNYHKNASIFEHSIKGFYPATFHERLSDYTALD